MLRFLVRSSRGGRWPTTNQRAALRRLGEVVADGGAGYVAAQALLRRDPPRTRRAAPGEPLPQNDVDAARRLATELDESYLVVQGPPGSGKTYLGARLIVQLISLGRRVGVAATSHKAIHNLLREVEDVARREGVSFRGLKKGSKYEGPFITTSGDQAYFSDPDDDVLLLAGTSWLFSREEMEGVVDTLFVDEAGQGSLADALAMGTCARNLVLLGDPQQLAQVSQGTHPEGAGASALKHVLAGEDTIPPERGLFLSITWRMHPDVSRFVSAVSYEGRLESAPETAAQQTSFGTGLRFLPVVHEGNRIASHEEADAVAAAIEQMVGADYTDSAGRTRPLNHDGFLFSRNRLNVAISRARCLAILVACPDLLDIRCRTIEEMRLANALCLAVEMAEETTVAGLGSR